MRAAVCAVLMGSLFVTGASLAQAPVNEPCPAVLEAAPQLVDLNTASEDQLLSLPGIGPSRAKAILAFRAAHGGFTSVSQLMRIKGFGRSMLQRLRPLVTISPQH